jgi:hypothetical protein
MNEQFYYNFKVLLQFCKLLHTFKIVIVFKEGDVRDR